MPSERVQRQIDTFLDQTEESATNRDWDSVLELVAGVLSLDSENEDALAFRRMAEQARGIRSTEIPTFPQSDAVPATSNISPVDSNNPSSFADGRYTVTRLLGEGGKKLVYLAHDATLDREVAFGLIKTDGLDDVGRERILREAQAMGRMGTHPCIMPIYDLGEENGQPFMVQPPMGGGDIEDLMEKVGGALPLDQVLKIANQTAQGLVFAHSKGIIHRDLKPGNVWLDDDGNAKIGDFGLAIATDRSRLTVEKLMVGTVNYMPPEQATGGNVTPRADLYSLGAMLYEMSTGRVPFMGDDDIAVISQHVNTPPVAPSWHNPAIPRTLDSLIIRLMSKDPDERPQSADEVLQALEAVDLSVVEEIENGQGSLEAMAGGVFVGRQREMDTLKSIFEEVLSGKGRMVTLVGEPGIGKTRTAQELATYVGMRGAQVLWGRSYESGGAPPYWPWVQALRSHVASTDSDSLRNQMGSTASVIAEVVADVREKLPDLPQPTPIDDPESARFRLFDSIATFLKQASSSTPIVLMLEDLHWSDKPSLMLLEFVARELSNANIMIVGNYRDMELNRRHPLSVTLGDLSRERLFERVVLRGLQKHDVQRFIEIAAGITPPPALVEAVYSQTEGNPLFVTETVRLLIQEGDITAGRATGGGTTSWEIRIPEGVREVIGRRLDRLSERCNELLTVASVIGRQFRFDVLKELAEDTTDDQLLDALDESLSARIVEELPEEVGLYQFTHASMQETLTSELSANRIVRMHARIAEALEQYYGDEAEEHAAELIEHFAEAETILGTKKALRYATAAGEQSLTVGAFEAALGHFEFAWRQSGGVDDYKSAILRGNMAKAYSSTARIDEAMIAVSEAFAFLAENGHETSAIDLVSHHFPITGLFVIQREINHALTMCEQGTVAEAAVLVNWSFVTWFHGEYAEAMEALEKARSIARDSAELVLQARAEAMRANIAGFQGDVETAIAGARAALELSPQVDDYASEMRARLWLCNSLARRGDIFECRKEADEFSKRARYFKDLTWISRSLLPRARIACALGEWELAQKLADEWREVRGVTLGADYIDAMVGTLTGVDKRTDAAIKLLLTHNPEASDGVSYRGIVSVGIWASRHASIHEDLIPAAKITLSELSGRDNFPNVEAFVIWAQVEDGVSPEAVRAAYELVSKMEPLFDLQWFEPVEVQRARLAQLIGETGKAIVHWESAKTIVSGGENPTANAWVSAEFASLLLERNEPGDREIATELQDESIAIATELGMQPLLERVLAQREILKA